MIGSEILVSQNAVEMIIEAATTIGGYVCLRSGDDGV